MSEYVSAALATTHSTAEFQCGKPALDDWLSISALRAQQQSTARTYVWTRPDDAQVLAYYSIAPTQVVAADLPRSAAGGHTIVPGYLLARLALDKTIQGQRLGGQLLLDALERIHDVADRVGGRLVLVDPIDAAAAGFYRHYGFNDCRTPQARMYLKIVSIAAILGK